MTQKDRISEKYKQMLVSTLAYTFKGLLLNPDEIWIK